MTKRSYAQGLRRELVHAAGCSYRGGQLTAPCATIGGVAENLADYIDACRMAKITPHIPRSLRRVEPAPEPNFPPWAGAKP